MAKAKRKLVDPKAAKAKAAAKRGRPEKFTPEIAQKITLAVEGGMFPAQAAQWAGVSPATYYSWTKRARDGDPEFLEFLESIRTAEASSEISNVTRVRGAAGGDWKAAAWFLERRFRNRWGRNVKVKHAGSVDLKLSGANAPLPSREEALKRYRELTERMTQQNAANPK